MKQILSHTKGFYLGVLFLFIVVQQILGQHNNEITAILDPSSNEISIMQKFTYTNTSQDTLSELYFNDWANAYANKNTALAKRFAEEFKKNLHLAKSKERGATIIMSVVDDNYKGMPWTRTKSKDIVKFTLNEPLAPQTSITLNITYKVVLPPNKYTSYGYDNKGGYYLKDWYMTPAVYKNGWTIYSNKNLDDLYTDITNTVIDFTYPEKLHLATNFIIEGKSTKKTGSPTMLRAYKNGSAEIILSTSKKFTKHVTPYMTVETDLDAANKFDEMMQGMAIVKVTKFIKEKLGDYPHKKLLVSELEYDKNPLYGINQLPNFIRPYSEQFQFELKFLKTALYNNIHESLNIDARKDKWVVDAIVNYLMINYVQENYPDQKLLGKLSKIWGVRSFNLAKMGFNDQYSLLSMLSSRKNIDQALSMRSDSLTKYNQQISNTYKSGLGMSYLADYIGKEKIEESIKTFYEIYKQERADAEKFRKILENSTEKDVQWFFKDYVGANHKIDFKIKKVFKHQDSLEVIIRNKGNSNVPISLFGLKNDSVISKYWFKDIVGEKTVMIPKNDEERLVLNYDKKIPEINQRNNWKSLKGFFSSNKKLRFQFFKDTENPFYNQVFYSPVISFNAYDGITPGLRLHNKSFLERPFVYDFAPSYATKQKSFVGYGKFNYRKYFSGRKLFATNFGLRASSFHFDTDARYTSITPSVSWNWRPNDRRSNKFENLFFRYVNIFRNFDENITQVSEPDYSVLNGRYVWSDNGILKHFSWVADAQLSNKFSKVALTMNYRKLFQNNRQLNLRLFAGKFISNNTDSDFFNFALDRPTDYMFDYSYLGRSDDTGIYSQQIIIAEGGFKSKLQDPFADDWLTTFNASTNLYRWIEVYGDIGFLKSQGKNHRFVYDAGIRLNLVTDYFEVFLPFYSNNGWEISQPNYDEKIRFIVTLSPRALTGLFTRKWF